MVRSLFSAVIALFLVVVPAHSEQPVAKLPDLSGPVILTVTGLDPVAYPGGKALFDLAMLQAMGQVRVSTGSIWTDGTHDYTGVALSALVKYLNIGAGTLTLHALNDYKADIPTAELEDNAPILAYDADGAPMPVRDKGPIWVLYPFDGDIKYRTDTVFSRSVWQLDRIDVLR